MRNVSLVSALMAAGALAQPVNEKRDIEWVTETQITYETVWVQPNAAPAATSAPTAPQSRVQPAPAAVQPARTPVAPVPAKIAPQKQPAQAQPASQAPAAQSGNSFIKAVVDGHNALRAQHGANPLTWSPDLAASAAALANECQFHHDVTLGPASNYGQNIAMSYGTLGLHSKIDEISQVIADSWYKGEEAIFSQLGLYGVHNPLNNDFEAWGHFTQEVWKDTTKVGCAVAACSSENGYSTVCNYDPAGNYADEFAENVSN